MCQPNKFSLILLGLMTSFVVADAIPLVLFEDTNFKGVRTEYRLLRRLTSCVNLRGKLNDFFSSVQNLEPNACFLLCEHEFCRGRCIRLSSSVTNLNALGFNDMTSSIRRCPGDATSSSSIPSQTPTSPPQEGITTGQEDLTTYSSTTRSSPVRDSSLTREDFASSTTTSGIDAGRRASSASSSSSSQVQVRIRPTTPTTTRSSHRRR